MPTAAYVEEAATPVGPSSPPSFGSYFLPFFLALVLSSREEASHQYLVAFLLCLTSEGQNFGCEWAESRLIPRVKMEVSGDLLLR